MDFIISPRGKPAIAIESKWQAERFHLAGLKAFSAFHSDGPNIVVTADTVHAFTRVFDGLDIRFYSLKGLYETLQESLGTA